MFKLIKGAHVYAPQDMGIKDILICASKIADISENINIVGIRDIEIIDGDGMIATPGFVDQHVHIIGGGGEGGFSTRTTEISAREVLNAGITTVVGILGADGVTRSIENLYAKAKALEEEGLSTFIYTGSYQVPVITLTGNIQRDLVYIDKVVGVGEIAICDHRSYNPSLDELCRIASDARMGGMIGGKAGIVHFHVGDSDECLKPLRDVIKKTMIPIAQLVPTHVNRNEKLFSEAKKYCIDGGYIDITAGFEREAGFEGCIPAYEALFNLHGAKISMDKVTMSSDGNGSIPAFNEAGELIGMNTASCKVLYNDFRKAIVEYKLPIDLVTATVTQNPSKLLKLANKGEIKIGYDSDILLFNKNMDLCKVFSKGELFT